MPFLIRLILCFVIGAQASGCSPAPQVTSCPVFAQVSVALEEATPRLDFTLSRAQITELLRTKSHELLDAQGLGVTVSSFNHRSQVELSNADCPSAAAKVLLSMPETTVYVANEFLPHTCKHQAVLEHEMRHVAINHTGLSLIKMRTEGYLNRELPALWTQLNRDSNLQDVSDAFIREKLSPFLSAEFAKLQTQQDALDTRAEYERLDSVCPEERTFLVRG